SPLDAFQRPLTEVSVQAASELRLVRTPPPTLPNGVDFRDHGWLPRPRDQKDLGSCVSFAASHLREFLSLQAGHGAQEHSPLWLYWNMRHRFLPPDQWDQDTGAYLSWAAAIIEGRGYALEPDWPYDTARFAEPPPPRSFGPAL